MAPPKSQKKRSRALPNTAHEILTHIAHAESLGLNIAEKTDREPLFIVDKQPSSLLRIKKEEAATNKKKEKKKKQIQTRAERILGAQRGHEAFSTSHTERKQNRLDERKALKIIQAEKARKRENGKKVEEMKKEMQSEPIPWKEEQIDTASVEAQNWNGEEANKKSVQSIPWGKQNQVDPNDLLAHLRPRIKIKPNTPQSHAGHVASVPIPKAGTAYLPEAEAHQELLLDAYEQEIKKLEALQKLEQRMRVSNELYEMDSDEVDTEWSGNSDNDEDAEGKQLPEHMLPRIRKKKSLRERSRLRRAKITLRKEEMNRVLKSQKATYARLAELRLELESNQIPQGVQKPKSDLPGRLGKMRYTIPSESVQLSDELVNSLRKLRPESNLFKERLYSLQRRGIVEPRIPFIPKKIRRKTRERFQAGEERL